MLNKTIRVLSATMAGGLVIAGAVIMASPSASAAPKSATATAVANASNLGCGTPTSSIRYVYPNHYQEKVGFENATDAVAYSATEYISIYQGSGPQDPLWASYTIKQDGGLAFRSKWTGQHTDKLPDGPFYMEVSGSVSFTLWDGIGCQATTFETLGGS